MQNTEVYLRKTIDMQIIFKKFFCGEGGMREAPGAGASGAMWGLLFRCFRGLVS